ncbi:GntR family transcriptional regulator [Tropicimonas sp. TH_r6]|uniref:GntR family transcriptional regulator n=1 Tax=Tropicimonas sp. TH_r6 TaxID=3082085 RepID=UPI002953899D|nr:GntR family transcriptional regulator [Tropicimonas sp. TH_r6]MDV7144717.1 GntR family transcriptional regulator [Tropicimonas sp. TH_r6]
MAGQEASATQKAYLALRRMIVVGELQPGEKLKIDRLRARLNTGASPIREALSLLTSDLLVERLDQRGFRAAPTSHENFVEILTLRCELEEMALRQSIANADEAWEDALVLAHHKMAREGRGDLESFEERHKAFHMALLANCNSPILMKFCSQLYDLNIRYRYLAGNALNYQKRDVSTEHSAILEAAVDRNADLAAERLLSHYHQTGAFLNGLFATNDSEG